ncbi:MAG: hypothetical protein AB7E37_02100 [Candidatus Altimarinota bacterium]
MQKIIILSLLFILSSCSIDWNGEKDKKIAELEKEISDNEFQKKIECGNLKAKMESSMKNFILKSSVGQDIENDISDKKIRLHFGELFYQNKLKSCIFSFNKVEDKYTDFGEHYYEISYYIIDYLSNNLIYSTSEKCLTNNECNIEKEYSDALEKIKGKQ